tara:strand:+ start:83 stop:499 length:417 start_codon:yes stop_codon:yes gene_type:complete
MHEPRKKVSKKSTEKSSRKAGEKVKKKSDEIGTIKKKKRVLKKYEPRIFSPFPEFEPTSKVRKAPAKKKLAPLEGKKIKETTTFINVGGSTMTHTPPGKARKAKERVKQKATIARGKRRDIKSIRKEKRKQIKKIRGR